MGRPPCCEKIAVKKGPWTPEEDIILVSYIQEHGPGNWRTVPTNTGLLRCSKSCRLRWTNYLRPGIKRGNFTDHEQKMIVHLQALLGNRWAAIASYIPHRTDNDIKNYWNTYLKKKLKKLQDGENQDESVVSSSNSHPKGQWERRLQTNIQLAKQALCEALSLDKPKPSLPPINESKQNSTSNINCTNHVCRKNPFSIPPMHQQEGTSSITTTTTTNYASSAENIAKLLKNWMKNEEKDPRTSDCEENIGDEGFNHSLFSFNSSNLDAYMDDNPHDQTQEATVLFQVEVSKPNKESSQLQERNDHHQAPLSLLEKWLLDDQAVVGHDQGGHHDDLMNMSMEGSGMF